jgi:hypothetical protein
MIWDYNFAFKCISKIHYLLFISKTKQQKGKLKGKQKQKQKSKNKKKAKKSKKYFITYLGKAWSSQ